MQKFGLKAHQTVTLNAAELEIKKEQATALGRAGKKLRLALEAYQIQLEADQNQASASRTSSCAFTADHALIKNIADNAWALILQREFLGFTQDNLQWVIENYRIPQAALNRIGRSD